SSIFSARMATRGELTNLRVGRLCGRVSSPGTQKSLWRSLRRVRPCHSSGKTRPLKSRDEVVGEPNHLQIERVGCKRTSGDLGKGKVFAYFPNASFHSGAAIIEVPHAGRCQRQVCMPGSIHVTPQGKQGWLGVTLLDQPPRHKATPGVRP